MIRFNLLGCGQTAELCFTNYHTNMSHKFYSEQVLNFSFFYNVVPFANVCLFINSYVYSFLYCLYYYTDKLVFTE